MKRYSKTGRHFLSIALVIGLSAGCSTIDKLNPFSSSVKLPELAPVKQSVQVGTLWRSSVPKGGEYVLVPARVGDSVYAAGRDGTIVRIDAGREVWKINAGMTISGGVGASEEFVVVGSPKGEVHAYGVDGKLAWKSRVSSEVLAPPAIGEGVVLVRSADSRIHALDLADGKRKWVYQRATPSLSLRSAAAPLMLDKAALAGFSGGKLLALSLANGGPLWEVTVALPRGATELERIADVTSEPVLGPRQVCAAAYQGRLGCFDPASGNALWTRDISSFAGMDTDGQSIYVTDEKGAVHSLDIKTGASIWKQDKLQLRGVMRPLVVGTYLAVADSKGLVHLLRRSDGEFAARMVVDSSGVRADLVRLSDSAFLVQCVNGELSAFSVP